MEQTKTDERKTTKKDDEDIAAQGCTQNSLIITVRDESLWLFTKFTMFDSWDDM
jgi:hypothetical protein